MRPPLAILDPIMPGRSSARYREAQVATKSQRSAERPVQQASELTTPITFERVSARAESSYEGKSDRYDFDDEQSRIPRDAFVSAHRSAPV